MGQFEKRYKHFCSKPIPNDITFQDVEILAKHFHCIVRSGGNHMKVVHIASGKVIPIPRHGNCIKEAYVKQLKKLFEKIEAEEN